MAQDKNIESVFKNEHQLYEQVRARVKNKTNYKFITDEDIIIDQEKEIKQYRERIEQLTEQINKLYNNRILWENTIPESNEELLNAPTVDYITEVFYAEGQIVKEITTYYK